MYGDDRMAMTSLTILTVLFSLVFVLAGAYFVFTLGYGGARPGKQLLVAGLLLIPFYGVLEWGLMEGSETVGLLALAVSGMLVFLGMNAEYREVTG